MKGLQRYTMQDVVGCHPFVAVPSDDGPYYKVKDVDALLEPDSIGRRWTLVKENAELRKQLDAAIKARDQAIVCGGLMLTAYGDIKSPTNTSWMHPDQAPELAAVMAEREAQREAENG